MSETWTVLKVLQWTANYLQQAGVDNGRLDGELLLAATLGLDRVGLYLNYDRPMEPAELEGFREFVKRRARREPLQYILGTTEFWSLPFKVTPAVLIPRPDTEILVEEALKRADDAPSILDVGTGSGAIAVALAHELPAAQVVAVDCSPEALAVARGNATLNGVDGRISFQEGDLFALESAEYDLVLSNPPYIPVADIPTLMPEVRDHEPRGALVGGEDGLEAYRALARQAPTLLRAQGWLLVEVGIGQAEAVAELLETAGLGHIAVRADYAGIPRVVAGQKP
ncbi:MAG: peptide chain release factor N(5)-glutamine methyltransferase [Desulfuromonadales bacterium]|uniref:peptide chain release factor N(5)-glutamine methyltransferase n=1 Tax=Desulfuromonas sp. KJ2020 TaxID=2919173 RepID=UPI0020A7709C|nr:peptide chain release factor N(5)-glutamine methyltransferase [Desulfuromonas sp. KJ2020]MCP3176545.1 peptide chain release factor N(5)-glutamine methyltransferase [Desulfuromonas sp. KJ2020]